MGHIAAECPTPKGKGKGKEDRTFSAKGMKGQEKGKGIKLLAAKVTTKEKAKGQCFAPTVGSVAMMPRDAGRSIQSSFPGSPRMLSKKITTSSTITSRTTE